MSPQTEACVFHKILKHKQQYISTAVYFDVATQTLLKHCWMKTFKDLIYVNRLNK